MRPDQLQKGYWTACDDHFCVCYPTLEEAKGHIRFQKEHMGSKGTWYIIHIKDYEFVKE